MIRPMTIAHSTYSIFGSAIWLALPKAAILCSISLPAKPIVSSKTTPGKSSAKRWDTENRGAVATAMFIGASPRNARQHAGNNQDNEGSGDCHGPAIEREARQEAPRLVGDIGHRSTPVRSTGVAK